MSVGSWRDEFLPNGQGYDDKPVAHSMRKWQGLTTPNLQKHGVERINPRRIADVRGKDFGSMNIEFCALCDHADDDCGQCLYVQFHGRPCDESGRKEGDATSPWKMWAAENDPQPMIDALQQMKDAGYE